MVGVHVLEEGEGWHLGEDGLPVWEATGAMITLTMSSFGLRSSRYRLAPATVQTTLDAIVAPDRVEDAGTDDVFTVGEERTRAQAMADLRAKRASRVKKARTLAPPVVDPGTDDSDDDDDLSDPGAAFNKVSAPITSFFSFVSQS